MKYLLSILHIRIFILLFILFFDPLYGKDTAYLTDSRIQGRLNIINGASAECVMHQFYSGSGWIQVEGEVGRNGIDGLYYKKKRGVIREVLVSESKWNTSRIGYSGKHKLIKQMSKEWILKTLSRLQKYRPLPEYDAIEKLINAGQYRGRLFRMIPMGEDKVQISIYKIKNKGEKQFETFLESRLRPITMGSPKNRFEERVLQSYNDCRAKYLKKYFPMLHDKSIERLLHDNYLQKEDLKDILKQ